MSKEIKATNSLILNLLAGVLLTTAVNSVGHATESLNDAWPTTVYNPKALEDDVILPMPCGGHMTFRKVLVPLNQPLDDLKISLGTNSGDWGVLESQYDHYIAGSFSDDGAAGRYYLMGKYEVSVLQYEAIMANKCPNINAKKRLPKTNVSWFEGVEFADRYSQWLLAHAKDLLPSEDNIPGFIRLPTETEWSFAARGGIAVSASEFIENRFPMPSGLNSYVWFAGPQSANGSLRFTGLLEPNPLGLHDTLGNADEMIFEPFSLRAHGRIHGQSGGFVVRGGNFLTPQSDIRTSWRIEQPYYREGSRNRLKTTGLRIVVVAPAITSIDRISALQEQWIARGTSEREEDIQVSDRVSTLLISSTDNSITQELTRVAEALRVANQRQREQEDRAIRSSLQSGAFMCNHINQLGRENSKRQDFLQASCSPGNPRSRPETCATVKAAADASMASLRTATTIYLDSIIDLRNIYSLSNIQKQGTVVAQMLNEQKNTFLSPYLDVYIKALTTQVKTKGTENLLVLNCKNPSK